MLTGAVVGTGRASTPGGPDTPYSLIKLDRTVENLREMAGEANRWNETVKAIAKLGNSPLYQRAQFTEQALAATAELLRYGLPVIAAQALDGRILGVIQYGPGRTSEGTIGLVATDPYHLAGAGGTPLKGVGTSLVAAASKDLLNQGVATVYLHPLDSEAMTFWQHRGFVICGYGNLMCIRGKEGIEKLMGTCHDDPCCAGGRQDCPLVCGEEIKPKVEAMRRA